MFNILWAEIFWNFCSLSCGEGQGTCFGTLALVSCLWLLASSLRFVVQTFCHGAWKSSTALIRGSCNAPYAVCCSRFAFLFPSSNWTHSFPGLLPAHHIPPPLCPVTFFHFPAAQLLCSPPRLILVHFPVPCHSLLSASPPHLLEKGVCGEDEMAVGLDFALSDDLILWD